jgi:hypothetical protein
MWWLMKLQNPTNGHWIGTSNYIIHMSVVILSRTGTMHKASGIVWPGKGVGIQGVNNKGI